MLISELVFVALFVCQCNVVVYHYTLDGFEILELAHIFGKVIKCLSELFKFESHHRHIVV